MFNNKEWIYEIRDLCLNATFFLHRFINNFAIIFFFVIQLSDELSFIAASWWISSDLYRYHTWDSFWKKQSLLNFSLSCFFFLVCRHSELRLVVKLYKITKIYHLLIVLLCLSYFLLIRTSTKIFSTKGKKTRELLELFNIYVYIYAQYICCNKYIFKFWKFSRKPNSNEKEENE